MILLNCNIINDTSFSTSTFTWDADGRLTDVMRPCLGDTSARAIWLSPDPMLDKYPEISPYAYCAWNPMKYVDPDGRDIYRYSQIS